ncbi:MAG: SDR family oxidoreductase [Gemmataceae bacterium]|nr:SDR family oxidoreductase [Gemmataceae bacterium]MDW8266274.1 SDR family oxidoreductase [Gemmataceae bacterium]
MDLELQGQVAVIVGAARGLGKAIAEAFVAEGADVALLDIAPEVSELARALTAAGARATAAVVDVADLAAVQRAAELVWTDFRRVDHLVYAVGIGSGGYGFPFWNVPPTAWERVLRVNLIGAAAVAHAFAPTMARARRGTILFLASVAGQIGSQTDPPYSASKAGLINFAQCAAKDLAPYGVRVNTLCPGMVRTVLNRAVWQAWAEQQPPEARLSYEEWAADKIRRLVPLNRWQTPEDIAAMAVFLASPRAQNITGQTINVDGGYVMHW